MLTNATNLQQLLRRLRIIADWLDRAAPEISTETMNTAADDIRLAHDLLDKYNNELVAALQRIADGEYGPEDCADTIARDALAKAQP